MYIRLKTIFTILILIISGLIICLDSGIGTDNSGDESNTTTNINGVKMDMRGKFSEEIYIITIDYYGEVYYTESYSNGTFGTPQLVDDLPTCWHGGTGVADFDNDGDFDFIVGSGSAGYNWKNVYYYEKLGAGPNFAPRRLVGQFYGYFPMDFAVGDFDDNGNIDFMTEGLYEVKARIFFGDGYGNFTFNETNDFNMYYSYGKSAGDLDEDGDIDIVIAGRPQTAGVYNIWWFENTANGQIFIPHDTGHSGSASYGIVVGDYDNDGHLDILKADNTGVWYFLKGDGLGVFSVPVTTGVDVGGSYAGYGDAFNFNIENDNNLDLVCFSTYSTGELVTYLGNGDTTFGNKIQIGDVGYGTYGVAAPTLTKIILNFPDVTPTSGKTSTYFNFTIKYAQIENTAPIKITVNVSGTEYPMIETDPSDSNYLDGKDYYFNITHLEIGMHSYQFYASDGLINRSTSPVNKPIVNNTPPNITTQNNLTALEDEYYEVNYEFDDIDIENVGQSIIWNFSSNANWLIFDNITAILNGTPTNDDVGSYWVNISINDTMEIDFTNFTLTVENVNDNPVINTINIEITYEDELYEVDYSATDIDSLIPNQIWSLDSNVTLWLDIDTATGIISGTPTNDDVGEYWVNVSVDDGDTGSAFSNYTLIVLNVNDPPEITTEDVLEAPVNTLYEVDYNATDIDSPLSQLKWSVYTNATSWLEMDYDTGVLSGTPAINDLGWYNVNVTVKDLDGGQVWQEFILVVTPIEESEPDNDPPVITTTDKLSITVGESYNVIYEATDDRTPVNSLIWFYNSNASWLSFNKLTRTLSGNPTLSHVGWYWVNVTVNDGEGGFDFHNFTLTVWATANQPPNITTEAVTNAIVGELYTVDYEAEDDRTPDEYLRWVVTTNVTWLSMTNDTGVLSGTPTIDDVGIYWISVSVFDGEGGWDLQMFVLYVTPEPITTIPPKLSNPYMTPTSGNIDTLLTFSVDYSHPEGHLPDSIQVVIDGAEFDMTSANGHYEYSTKLSEGYHTYYFTTKLGDFKVDTETFDTGYVTDPRGLPVKGDGDGKEDNTMLYALIGIIVIVIVVLILLFIFLKKKKETEEEAPVEEAEPPPPEEVPPEVPPEQPPIPEVPPEQVPSPETPPEQPPIPEVTPQVVPQVEPAPQPEPMPQVEEPQPIPQVEQPPQVEAEEPAVVEHPEESQPQPVPKIKTEPTIEENNA